MRKSLLGPVLALLLGLVGFGLRKWELASAFELSGLVTPWMPATIALGVLSAVAAVLFFLLARKGSDGKGGPLAKSSVYMTGMVLSSFLLLASSLLRWAEFPGVVREIMDPQTMQASNTMLSLVLPPVLAVLGLFTAWAIFSMARTIKKGQVPERFTGKALFPGYFACLWLIFAYQHRNADPVVQAYLYELLAIMCLLMAAYYMASFFFEKPKAARAVFFFLMAAYFSLVTLADGFTLSTAVLFVFAVIYSLTCAYALLGADVTGVEHEMEGNPNE